MPDPALLIERHDRLTALAVRDEILVVYRHAHADLLSDPWTREDSFWDRLERLYAPSAGFELLLGRIDDQAIGYVFGSPRTDPAEIWDMVRRTQPDIEVRATSEPMYVLREIAVHPSHQGRGRGRALHDALLANRPERLAQLLVRADNHRARAAYQSWGWLAVGRRQPTPDAPVGETMVKLLRLP